MKTENCKKLKRKKKKERKREREAEYVAPGGQEELQVKAEKLIRDTE